MEGGVERGGARSTVATVAAATALMGAVAALGPGEVRAQAEPPRAESARIVEGPTIRFDNGVWYDGDFRERTAWTVDGVLTFEEPRSGNGAPGESVDRVVDLQGGWVVPAFGEAHTHRLSDPGRMEADAADFLADGVFYAMVQDPSEHVGEEHRALSSDPRRVDVAYTQGVVAPSWSVIAQMYGMLIEMGKYADGVTVSDLDGDILFTLDTVEELEQAWPELRARNSDHVKVIVAFADELERRRADPDRFGAQPPRFSAKPGVSEAVLRALVRKAHADGLRVSAHIETAADFRLAVDAGADLIAHMPASWQVGEGTGYGADDKEPWLLTPEDAQAARASGATVLTTLSLPQPDDPREPLFREIHEHNLTVLDNAGTRIAIGSDLFTGTSVDEALFVKSLGVLSDHELLELLAVATPRTIFPDRRIGHLREGYEASFLVLGGDPTRDLERIRDVRLRVKQGIIVEP